MARRRHLVVVLLALLLPALPVRAQLLVSPLPTAQVMAETIAGPGVAVSNATFVGADPQRATFAGGSSAGLAIDSGVLLSSGNTNNTPNNDTDTASADYGGGGDSALATLAPLATRDAAVLEFDVTPASSVLQLRFIFGSDDYPEFLGSQYVDVMGFFLNGTNFALVPGSGAPVSVNTINSTTSSALYISNPKTSPTVAVECDGLTTVLTARTSVTPGQPYRLKLGISDVGDFAVDSWIFIQADSLISVGFDPNGDNAISVADAFYLVNYLFTAGPAPRGAAGMTASADANGDGAVTAADIVFTVRYLFPGGPVPRPVI